MRESEGRAKLVSLLLMCCLLTLASACGSSKGSGAAAGGDGSDDPNGAGNASTGASGNTGGSGHESPGDFGSIWRAASAEHTVLDTAAPSMAETIVSEVPELVPHPDLEQEVEIFQQFVDDQLLLYVHPAEGEVYYQVARSATPAEGAYVVSRASAMSVYQIEDGVLTQSSSLTSGMQFVITTTTFQKYEDDFPPADWPTEVIEIDMTGGLP